MGGPTRRGKKSSPRWITQSNIRCTLRERLSPWLTLPTSTVMLQYEWRNKSSIQGMVGYYNLRHFCVPTKKITAWLVQSKIIGSKTFLGGTNLLEGPAIPYPYFSVFCTPWIHVPTTPKLCIFSNHSTPKWMSIFDPLAGKSWHFTETSGHLNSTRWNPAMNA